MKNILVKLDHSSRSHARFELALSLAEQQQASLTGLFATAATVFSQDSEKKERQDIRAVCEDHVFDTGVKFNWLDTDKCQANLPIVKRISQQALYSDLLILGQPEDNSGAFRELVDQLIMVSGCPIMTIPYAGDFTRIGQQVMVAWKAGRSSARALRDSVPIIRKSQDVVLLCVVNTTAEWGEAKQSQQLAIEYLQHSGVNARAELLMSSDMSYGDVILNYVSDLGIDLLVAGAAPPSTPGRIAEHLLKQMTIPVLMSN